MTHDNRAGRDATLLLHARRLETRDREVSARLFCVWLEERSVQAWQQEETCLGPLGKVICSPLAQSWGAMAWWSERRSARWRSRMARGMVSLTSHKPRLGRRVPWQQRVCFSESYLRPHTGKRSVRFYLFRLLCDVQNWEIVRLARLGFCSTENEQRDSSCMTQNKHATPLWTASRSALV